MKKLSLILAVLLCMLYLATACKTQKVNEQTEKKQILVTCFSVYDWIKNILGEDNEQIELSLIMENGVDLHSYQATAEDMVKIKSSDMIVYVGGQSEEWVRKAANGHENEFEVMQMLELWLLPEELKDGMHNLHDEDGQGEHDEMDEHVWLSLENAAHCCEDLAQRISELDMENKEKYIENAQVYIKELLELGAEYGREVEQASNKTLMFGGAFPFRYLLDDYGLDYYAVFSGCSSETDASFETIIFMANKLDELGAHSLILTENCDDKVAKTIIQSSKDENRNILVMNSMQSVTAQEIEAGASYIDIMRANLEVLKQALA